MCIYTCILYSYRIHLLGGSSYLLRHGGRVWGLRSWADGVMDRGWIGMENCFFGGDFMDVYRRCLSFVNWIESHIFFVKWTKELQWFLVLVRHCQPLKKTKRPLMIHGGQAFDGSTGEASIWISSGYFFESQSGWFHHIAIQKLWVWHHFLKLPERQEGSSWSLLWQGG